MKIESCFSMLVAPWRWREGWARDDLAYSAEPLVSMGNPIIKIRRSWNSLIFFSLGFCMYNSNYLCYFLWHFLPCGVVTQARSVLWHQEFRTHLNWPRNVWLADMILFCLYEILPSCWSHRVESFQWATWHSTDRLRRCVIHLGNVNLSIVLRPGLANTTPLPLYATQLAERDKGGILRNRRNVVLQNLAMQFVDELGTSMV